MIRQTLALLLAARAIVAQEPMPKRTHWWLATTIGGFATGASVGYALTAVREVGPFPSSSEVGLPDYQRTSWAGATIGAIVGFVIGNSVDNAVRRRRPVSAFKKRAVQFTTIFAGAAAGAAVSYNLMWSHQNRYRWHPVRAVVTFSLPSGLGAIAGFTIQKSALHTLGPPPPSP